MVLVPLYIVTTNTIGVFFLEDMNGVEIKYSAISVLAQRFCKVIVLITLVFFTDYAWLTSIVAMLIFGFLCFFTWNHHDHFCSIPVISRVKRVVYAMCCWASLCSLIGALTTNADEENTSWASFILLVVGLVGIAVATPLVYYITKVRTGLDDINLFNPHAELRPRWYRKCLYDRRMRQQRQEEEEAEAAAERKGLESKAIVPSGTGSIKLKALTASTRKKTSSLKKSSTASSSSKHLGSKKKASSKKLKKKASGGKKPGKKPKTPRARAVKQAW
jgi:hypothetical protein